MQEHDSGAKGTSLWTMCSHVLNYLKLERAMILQPETIHALIKTLCKGEKISKAQAFTPEQLFGYISSLDDSDETIVTRLYIIISY